MRDDNMQDDEKADMKADAAEDIETAAGEDAEDVADAPVDAPEEDSVEDKLAAANDQLLRALAELENTRRRAERDRGEALKYGAMSFARDIVGVADNLARALKAIEDTDEAAKADLPEAVQALLEGVDATQRDLMATLARHKVTPIAPLGEKE